MANTLWRKTRGGSSGARIFAAYVALVLVVAMVGPGLSVYAAEGEAGEEPPIEALIEPAPEPLEEPEPLLEPEPEVDLGPDPGPDPVEPIVPPGEPSLEGPVMMAAFVGPVIVPLASVTPVFVPGNPALGDGGIKLDPPAEGTFYYDDFLTGDNEVNQPGVPLDFWITIDIYDDGTTFSFTSNYPIIEVIVKGGDNANSYIYPGGTYGDEDLLSPLNNGGNVPGLSHMIFYFGTIEGPETGDIEVHKFLDANENGEYDDGEEMLEDWEMTLYDGEESELESELTDDEGKAEFAGLVPGTYVVTETMQPDWTNITPISQEVEVVAGQTAMVWFGNIPTVLPPETGDIEVYKFLDANENGEYDDGEEMLEDWEMTLYDGEESELESDLTDDEGKAEFDGLKPGTYVVTETMQPDWTNITPISQEVEVVAGQTAMVWFGNIPTELPPETGDLVIYKYNDLNRNGVRDEGEPMLEDWEFTVERDLDVQLERIVPMLLTVVGSGLTDEDGELPFDALLPGEYTVTETPQEGWDNITPLVQAVEVEAGETTEVWFGNAEQFLPFTELDLAITKVVDDRSVVEGQLVKYTLTYWNNGDLAAEDFTIVDDYDERYLSIVDAAGGVVSGGKITWTLAGPLAKVDGMKTITYTARVTTDMPDTTTNIDNVVVISHPRDADPSNNTDNERVVYTVSEPFLPFTGGDYTLLIGFAVAAAALGLLLRLRTVSAA